MRIFCTIRRKARINGSGSFFLSEGSGGGTGNLLEHMAEIAVIIKSHGLGNGGDAALIHQQFLGFADALVADIGGQGNLQMGADSFVKLGAAHVEIIA